jgi:hypothetical protein
MKKLVVFLLAITMYACAFAKHGSHQRMCEGWIDPVPQYDTMPSVSQVWLMSDKVFQRTEFIGYSSKFPHYCDVREQKRINCAAQAVILEAEGRHFVPEDLSEIRLYCHKNSSIKHAIYTVRIDAVVWLFDRNYGVRLSGMPMTENNYIDMYDGDMRQCGAYHLS